MGCSAVNGTAFIPNPRTDKDDSAMKQLMSTGNRAPHLAGRVRVSDLPKHDSQVSLINLSQKQT